MSEDNKNQIPCSDVLIVDDNAQNAELLQAYLEPLDCTSRIAVDGLDALDRRSVGDLARFRRYELAAALNRLRTLQVT